MIKQYINTNFYILNMIYMICLVVSKLISPLIIFYEKRYEFSYLYLFGFQNVLSKENCIRCNIVHIMCTIYFESNFSQKCRFRT